MSSQWYTYRKATRMHLIQSGTQQCDGARIIGPLYTEEQHNNHSIMPRSRCLKCLAIIKSENKKVTALKSLTTSCTSLNISDFSRVLEVSHMQLSGPDGKQSHGVSGTHFAKEF